MTENRLLAATRLNLKREVAVEKIASEKAGKRRMSRGREETRSKAGSLEKV